MLLTLKVSVSTLGVINIVCKKSIRVVFLKSAARDTKCFS